MQTPRHFLLSQQPGRVVRLLSGMADPPADKPRSWVTVTREGSFTDPRWGRFEISRDMLLAMVANFEQGVVGMRPMVMLIFAESHLKAVRMIAMSDIQHGLKFMRLRNGPVRISV
ncbi:hypothetical protein [Aquitalea palustris]|uniref:hypothetical protein n=1 Tax=Aquitalea palustris TaxID=2480983 RepID=UPI0011C383B6|nr:hypothetical protein [Aquitalea palustris]